MNRTHQFVSTAAIREAVIGREADILSVLGIHWTGTSTHIHCPYPDHDDKHPSWRWDQVKKRAHCNCASSASILDVIAKAKGIDFEAAKIAAAQIIGLGRVGITHENAIRWIEMDWGTPHCSVFELPLNMPGLKEFGEREGIREGTWPTVEEWRKLFSFMGIDPLEWASVRLFEITAGAAAQAKFTGVSFDLIWYDGATATRWRGRINRRQTKSIPAAAAAHVGFNSMAGGFVAGDGREEAGIGRK